MPTQPITVRLAGVPVRGLIKRIFQDNSLLVETVEDHARAPKGELIKVNPDEVLTPLIDHTTAEINRMSMPEVTALSEVVRQVSDVKSMVQKTMGKFNSSIANINDALAKANDMSAQVDAAAAELRSALGMNPSNNPPAA